MSLEDKEKLQSPSTPATGAASCAPEKTAPHEAHDFGHHKPLLAERIFDVSAYGIWNYVIQTGTSVLAGMWFRDGGGKPYFDKAATWLGDNVVSKISNKRGLEAAAEARTPLVFGALIMVGNFFIPPIQYAECRKEKIVSWINDWLNARRTANGNAPSEQELKEQRETIKAIGEEPRQTSASLWGGRALGLTANIVAASVVGEKRNVAMQEAVANTVTKGLKTVGAPALAANEKVRNFSRIAFLDYGYSIISANIIYVYSHFINPPKEAEDKKHIAPVDCAPSLTSSPPQAGEGNGAYVRQDVSAVGGGTFPPTPRLRGELDAPAPELLTANKVTQLKPTNPERYAPQPAL